LFESLSPNLQDNARRFIDRYLGLSFDEKRNKDLARGLHRAKQKFGFEDINTFVTHLLSGSPSTETLEILASYFTVGESYFFRDKRFFEALENHLLPELIARRRNKDRSLRIWSAGCSTGEEPYSIAILLNRLVPDLAEWNITILGTDLNIQSLQKAQKGIYRPWSFRGGKTFDPKLYVKDQGNDTLRLRANIRNMVSFSYLNLIENYYPSEANNTTEIDLLLCRNVLIYFTHTKGLKVVRKLKRAVASDGILALGPSELQIGTEAGLKSIFVSRSFFFVQDLSTWSQYQDSSRLSAEVTKASLPADIQSEFAEPLQSGTEPFPEFSTPDTDLPEPVVPADSDSQQEEEPGRADSVEETLAKAEEYIQAGKYTQVLELLETSPGRPAISDQTRGVDIYMLLARAHANCGNRDHALAYSDRAVSADKMNPETHYLRAMVQLETGDLEESEKELQRVLYLDPDHLMAVFTIGSLKKQTGSLSDAYRYFEQVLKLLEKQKAEEEIPGTEGMRVDRLRQIIQTMMERTADR